MNAESYTNDGRIGDPNGNADASSGNGYQSLIHGLYNCIDTSLSQLIHTTLDSASDALFELSEKSDTSEMQNRYMDLISRLRIERSMIESGFFVALNNKLRTQSGFVESSGSVNELELVGRDEMEELVMITKLSTDAMNTFGEEANNLEARLEYLELMVPELFEKSALNPTGIYEAFQQALKAINMNTPEKLIMFDLFGRSACSSLGDMYRELNQSLIDADILPEIIFKTQHDEEPQEEAVVRTASYYDPQSNKTSNYIKRSQQELDHMVSQFMNGFTVAEGEGIPASFSVMPTDRDRLNGFTRKEVAKALSRLQSKLLNSRDRHNAIDTEQLKRSLMEDMASRHGGALTKKVSILDERSIDFVGMMFQAIKEDENITQAITGMLQRLQIAVTKVALLDQNLFSHEDHPARRTLNLITEAGKGVIDEEDTVCHDLQSIVDDILEDYDTNIETFENAVDSLQQLIDNQQKLADSNEKEAQRTVIKQHAREVVLTELRYASSNKHLPAQVQPLVLKHWSSLMLNRYIRHGKDSLEWMESTQLLKLLVNCLQPIQNRKQWEMVKNNHLPLTSAVNDELYDTQQDKSEIDDQVEKLKKTFIRMLDEYGFKMVNEEPAVEVDHSGVMQNAPKFASNVVEFRPAANVAQNVEVDDSGDDEELDEADAEKAQIELIAREAKDKLAQLPVDVKPGVWFQIFNGEDHVARRLKLSVILTEVAKLIFVDCHGVKVIEKDAGDFVNELHEHKSRSIADHSTFEHALGQVIHSLAA